MALKIALDTCVLLNMVEPQKEFLSGGAQALDEYINKTRKEMAREWQYMLSFPQNDKSFTIKKGQSGDRYSYHYKNELRKRTNIFEELEKYLLQFRGETQKSFGKEIDFTTTQKLYQTPEERKKKYTKKKIKERNEHFDALIEKLNISSLNNNQKADVLTKILLSRQPENVQIQNDLIKDIEASLGRTCPESDWEQKRENLDSQAYANARNAMSMLIKRYLDARDIEKKFLPSQKKYYNLYQNFNAAQLLKMRNDGKVEFYVLQENFDEFENHILKDSQTEKKKDFLYISEDDAFNAISGCTMVVFDEGLTPAIKALSRAYRSKIHGKNIYSMSNDINSLKRYGDANSMAEASIAGLTFATFNGKDFIFHLSKSDEQIRKHIMKVNRDVKYSKVVSDIAPYTPEEIIRAIDSMRNRSIAEDIEILSDEDGATLIAKAKEGITITYEQKVFKVEEENG